MSSRIEQLIDEIEDYIESCKPKFMSVPRSLLIRMKSMNCCGTAHEDTG